MIYLDNSATTKPYQEVIDAFSKVSTSFWGNPSSLHGIGGKAENLLLQATKQAAALLGVKEREIIFTSGATESNNMAIKGIADQYRQRGKHIIASSIEHPSVYEPLEQLKKSGCEISFLPVDGSGRVCLSELEKMMRDDTILVSVMHVNNETGVIQPIQEIGEIVNRFPKAYFHVDGVQGFGKVSLPLTKNKIDLYSLSAHKFHGLKGTGLLYVRNGIVLSPLIAGGNQQEKRRSGTENVAGIVAMSKAMRLVTEKSEEGLSNLIKLQSFLMEELQKIKEITMNTPTKNKAPHIVNFSVPGLKPEVLIHTLEEKGIYVSTTSACTSKQAKSSKQLLQMGKSEVVASSSVRISLSYDNTINEIKEATEEIVKSLRMLREVVNK